MEKFILSGGRVEAKAFSILELLVTVIVIGVVVGIAIPQYKRVISRAQAQETVVKLSALAKGEKAYRLEYGQYLTIWYNPATNLAQPPINPLTGTGYSKDERFHLMALENPDTADWQYGFGWPTANYRSVVPCAIKRIKPNLSCVIFYSLANNRIVTAPANESQSYPGIEPVPCNTYEVACPP